MTADIGDTLDEREIEAFLSDAGIGVLGMAFGNEAYTIPIAFVFDESGDRCVFRFVSEPGSTKRTFASETSSASLTVVEWNSLDDWRSVVIRGPLEAVPDADLAYVAGLFSDAGDEAALEVFNSPLSDYETTWYQLAVAEISGRGVFPRG